MTPGPRWGRYCDGATELQRFGADSNRSIVLLDSSHWRVHSKIRRPGVLPAGENPFGPHGCQGPGGLLSWSPHGQAVVVLYL